MVQNVSHFADYANEICNVNLLYFDKNNIQYPNIDGSIYVHVTLKAHQVKIIIVQSIEFFFNSQCKNNSKLLRKISYRQLVSGVTDFSPNDVVADEINTVEPERN